MALHWSVEDVADMDNVCFYIAGADDVGRGVDKGDKLLQPVTEALIWATMPVGIGHITATNADDFYTRMSAWHHLNGAPLWGGEKDGGNGGYSYITRDQVKAHIGLSTNASTKSITQFWKDLRTTWERNTRG